ncbi:MAG: diguanylate cyclase [Lachnospiraceae bacterium]
MEENKFLAQYGTSEFCEGLKKLTWQLRRVAEGDYSQKSEQLGELSEVFNEMVNRLQDRETKLKEKLADAVNHIETAEGFNELMVELLSRRNEWLLVVDMDSREIIYCNKKKKGGAVDQSYCDMCKNRLSFQAELLKWDDREQYKVWEMDDEKGNAYYRITSFPIDWKERNAGVHVVVDITDEKRMTSSLTSKAYHDPGTGIKNRLFFDEYMEMILRDKQKATLCYLDLDGLKYVNDKFGHQEGDIYIQYFVELIRGSFRSGDTFARIGGDEFCIVLTGAIKELIERKMEELLHEFQTGGFREYRCSFSYGVVEITGEEDEAALKELLQEADEIMYECKRRNKAKYPELIRG